MQANNVKISVRNTCVLTNYSRIIALCVQVTNWREYTRCILVMRLNCLKVFWHDLVTFTPVFLMSRM